MVDGVKASDERAGEPRVFIVSLLYNVIVD